MEVFIRRTPLVTLLRPSIEQSKRIAPRVVWRNYEMSYSVHQLAIHIHFPTTMTLQEYFIPVEHAYQFAKKLRSILKRNWVNVLNVSIRHVAADTTSLMSYAPRESFAFVLYLNLFNWQTSIARSCRWTQRIINAALQYDGKFYLPYIMCATQQQFDRAYPQFKKLLAIKKIYDPENKFRNMLLEKYGKTT
jgi:FAD/FMN-containing dehydrogenase